jgi:formylmethanofuran dehydrogenase subunit E
LDKLTSEQFESLLEESVRFHGHLCGGQVLGVRMSLLGLRHIGIDDPKGTDRKNIIVFVEMDRCVTDAIQSVTGCSIGKRTMKFMDFGKMAATFVNLGTGEAIRILAREDSRQKAKERFPHMENKYAGQLAAYRTMSNMDLFKVMPVQVQIRPEDMPGRPLNRVVCDACGEHVQDGREVQRVGTVLCKACAGNSYYGSEKAPAVDSAMQKNHNGLDIRSKIWIEMDGEPVFGRGRRFLLEAIDTYGSISQAAKVVGISYRKAWGHIQAMEKRLGIVLVTRQTGGRNGGGAALTPEARDLFKKFEMMEIGLREFADARFREMFRGQEKEVLHV